MTSWYSLKNEDEILTPAVLLYPERIKENIRRMIAVAGTPRRLRPHVKTHKIPQIVQMQINAGINKFKCATLAELQMVAIAGGKDILLSYPLVGPALNQFFSIIRRFPDTRFSVTIDNTSSCRDLEKLAAVNSLRIPVFIDIDNGMHRTGIAPGREAADLARYIQSSGHLQLAGIHVYDGHIRDADIEARRKSVEKQFKSVLDFLAFLENKGIRPEEMVCGGSPTFPVHALAENRTLSPGTTLLWDSRHDSSFSDEGFLPAAVLAARIVSKPMGKLLCLDLGHKAVASEMPHPRVKFFDIGKFNTENHSEEHIVISTENHSGFSIGQVIYALPVHICPTMALHEQVYVVEEGRVIDKWEVTARKRIY